MPRYEFTCESCKKSFEMTPDPRGASQRHGSMPELRKRAGHPQLAVFIALLVRAAVLGILVAPLGSVAQQPGMMHHVGVLGTFDEFFENFRQGLREAGYVEGQNLVIEYRPFAQGSAEGLATKAVELVRLKVEVIFTVGPAALNAAANATRQIPIVAFDAVTDPVAAGFAKSLSRPGGNVTGIFLDLPELMGNWLQSLRDIIPRLSRVAVLWDPASGPYLLSAASGAGRVLRLRVQTLEVRTPEDFGGAFAAAMQEHAEAMIQLSSPLVYFNSQRLAELALKNRMPAISLYRVFPESGGLMSYGPGGHLLEFARDNGARVGRILSGAKPGDLPIERPSKFELVINLKTAKALGLRIPQSLLLRADEVIR